MIIAIIHDKHHHYCLSTGIRSELEQVDKPISTPDGRLTTGKDDDHNYDYDTNALDDDD
jgi:hypothetical protein